MKARKSIGVIIIILSAVLVAVVQLQAVPKEQLADLLRPCILQASKVKSDAQTLMGLADDKHAEQFIPQYTGELQKKMEDLKSKHDAFLNVLDDDQKKLYADTIERLNKMYESMSSHMLDLKQLAKKAQIDRNAVFATAQSIQKTAGEWQMEYRGMAQALKIKLERG